MSDILTPPEKIILLNPQDPHQHLRGYNGPIQPGDEIMARTANNILNLVTPMNKYYSRILAMSNTLPRHLETPEDIKAYEKLVEQAAPLDEYFTETMYVVSLTDNITAQSIEQLKWHIKGVKYYPGWVTTNSGWASDDIDITKPQTREVLEAMQKNGIVLNLHPETTHKTNEYDHSIKWEVSKAEREFKDIVINIAETFPDLKIVIEHISTKEMADIIASGEFENVYGSVTPQHLMLTAHDKEWGHWFDTTKHCKPTLKEVEDMLAIQNLVLSWNSHIFFGSDSAPHPIHAKEALCCAAWVFSNPIGLEIITDWFFKPTTMKYAFDHGLIDKANPVWDLQNKLQAFMWINANKVYGATNYNKAVTLEKTPFIVPERYWKDPEVVPIFHGETLQYSVASAIAHTNDWVKDLMRL